MPSQASHATPAAVSRETARPVRPASQFQVHRATRDFESYEDYLEYPDRANLSIGAHTDAQQLPSRAELAHYDAQRKAADATRVIAPESPRAWFRRVRGALTNAEAVRLTERCEREGIDLVEATKRFIAEEHARAVGGS